MTPTLVPYRPEADFLCVRDSLADTYARFDLFYESSRLRKVRTGCMWEKR